jgi:hypothetical protein
VQAVVDFAATYEAAHRDRDVLPKRWRKGEFALR